MRFPRRRRSRAALRGAHSVACSEVSTQVSTTTCHGDPRLTRGGSLYPARKELMRAFVLLYETPIWSLALGYLRRFSPQRVTVTRGSPEEARCTLQEKS